MPRLVFIDIGAHNGGSVQQVLDGGYPFDRIISVEPDPEMVAHLENRFAAERARGLYEVAPVGLAAQCGTAMLYGDNSGGGASLHASKMARDDRAGREITLIDWASFLERYGLGDARLYVKINAEGAEVAIIESIIAEGGANIADLVVDYDIVKTPFGAWKKWRSVRALKRADVPFQLAEDVFIKRGERVRLQNWLSAFAELQDPPLPSIKPPLFPILRERYLEVVSAVGLRQNMFKRRRSER